MKSKHTIEIEIKWEKGAHYAVVLRKQPGYYYRDPRTNPVWSDDDLILIERPKPDNSRRRREGICREDDPRRRFAK